MPARDQDTGRTGEPVVLVEIEGATYLIGWCLVAGAQRTFRLDRVVGARILEVDVVRRELSSGVTTGAVLAHDGSGSTVTLRLSRKARWVAEYHPVEQLTEGANGSLRVTMRIVDRQWLERLLLRLSPHVRILGDPELRRAHRERLAAVLSLNEAVATRAA